MFIWDSDDRRLPGAIQFLRIRPVSRSHFSGGRKFLGRVVQTITADSCWKPESGLGYYYDCTYSQAEGKMRRPASSGAIGFHQSIRSGVPVLKCIGCCHESGPQRKRGPLRRRLSAFVETFSCFDLQVLPRVQKQGLTEHVNSVATDPEFVFGFPVDPQRVKNW